MRLRIGHEWHNRRIARAGEFQFIEQMYHPSCMGEELRDRQHEAKREPTEVEEEGHDGLFGEFLVGVHLEDFGSVELDTLFYKCGSEVERLVVFLPVQVLAFEALQRV